MGIFTDPYENFFLDYLITKLENGSNTKQALMLYAEQVKGSGSFKKRLDNAIKELDVGKEKIDKILYKNGFLSEFEYGVIQNAPNLHTGLRLINTIKTSSSNLFKHMLYPIFVPLSTIIATFYFLLIYLDILVADVASISKYNPSMIQFLGIPAYFDKTIVLSLFIFSIIVTISLFLFYFYTHLYKSRWLYKVLKTQAYADGIILFRMIHEMLKIGIPLHNVALLLSKNYFNKGLRKFFKDMADNLEHNKPLYIVFEKYNFPVLMSADIKLSESSQISYENISKTLFTTCDIMYAKGLQNLLLQWNMFFWAIALAIVVVVGSDIINVVIASFTVKML